MAANRWQQFRSSDDSIPENPFEAGVFVQNARAYLQTYGHETMDARLALNDAHERINNAWIASTIPSIKEVA